MKESIKAKQFIYNAVNEMKQQISCIYFVSKKRKKLMEHPNT